MGVIVMKPLFVFNNDMFFRNFVYFKEKYCLSRKALSKLLGVSVYTIEDIEKNRCDYDLPVSLIVRCSQIFGVDMDAIVSFDFSKHG